MAEPWARLWGGFRQEMLEVWSLPPTLWAVAGAGLSKPGQSHIEQKLGRSAAAVTVCVTPGSPKPLFAQVCASCERLLLTESIALPANQSK